MPLPFDADLAADRIVVYIDGGARGNPGPAGFGVRVEREDGTPIEELSESIGVATNNVAEYRGLVAALEWARARGHRVVHVRSDSLLLVQQMLGRYKVKHPGLQPLHAKATQLARGIGRVTFEHVGRAQNAHADRLANAAMDAASAGTRAAPASDERGSTRSSDPTPGARTADPPSRGLVGSRFGEPRSGARSPEPAARLPDIFTSLERTVRLFVYRHFVDTARAPDTAAIIRHTGAEGPAVAAALRKLADSRALVLAPASIDIWMAHPFSAVPTSYPVAIDGRTYYANCAWDAAGVLSILRRDGESRTRCADCGAGVSMAVKNGEIVGDGVVHYAVPPRRFWENVAFT